MKKTKHQRSELRTVIEAKAFTRDGSYCVDVPWDYLETWLNSHKESGGLDLDPDFQRAHVWTETQQERFVEYVLRGGYAGKEIRWNCATWMSGYGAPVQIVDGKQRLEAVRKFMRGELKVFGKTLAEWGTPKDAINLMLTLRMHVNDLKTRAEVLQWYLDLNAGGTPHTDEEISKVRVMLDGQEPEENRDAHTEHCCGMHKRCKYGDEDGGRYCGDGSTGTRCTVASGEKRPSFPCNCDHF